MDDDRVLSRHGYRAALLPYAAGHHGARSSPLTSRLHIAEHLSPGYGSPHSSAFDSSGPPQPYPSILPSRLDIAEHLSPGYGAPHSSGFDSFGPPLPYPSYSTRPLELSSTVELPRLWHERCSPCEKRFPSPITGSLPTKRKSFKDKSKKKTVVYEALAQETQRLPELYRTCLNEQDEDASVVAVLKRKNPEGMEQDKADHRDNDVVSEKRKRRKQKRKQHVVELQRDASKSFAEFFEVDHVHEKYEIKKREEQYLNAEGGTNADPMQPVAENQREEKAFKFLSKYLEENRKLSNLYVNNWRRGTFECLVCGSEGTVVKEFSNVVRLLIHTTEVQRIPDKRPEHQAFRRVLCSVLGWHHNEIPKVPGRNKKNAREKKRAQTSNEIEASLEVQRCVCNSITNFLGIEPVEEKSELQRDEHLSKEDEETKADAQVEKASRQDTLIPEEEREGKGFELLSEQETLTPEEEKEREEKSLKFFSECLQKHEELCKFYLEHWEQGIFECPICFSIYKQPTRTYHKLVRLVLHSYEVKHAQPEHRAYGHALCSLLDWEYCKTSTPKIIMKRLVEAEHDANASQSNKEDKDGTVANSGIDVKEMTDGQTADEGKMEDPVTALFSE